MKCKNCGANYKMRELRCPYCGTINPKGYIQQALREQAESEYDRASTKTLGQVRRRMVNKVLNRTLLVEIAGFVLIFLVAFLCFFGYEAYLSVRKQVKIDSMEQHMEELYTQGRFRELHVYMDKNALFDPENDVCYEYAQMALIHYDYIRFVQSRMEYFANGGEISEYELEQLLREIHNILCVDISAYPELTERNEEIWKGYCREAEACASGLLELNEAQMELLRQEDFSWDGCDQLAEDLMQRRAQDGE